MTPRTILLNISLLANAALVAAYLAIPTGAPHVATTPTQAPAAANTSPAASAIPGGTAEAAVTRPAQPALSWAAIDTPDIDELARRLKTAGFTPEEVRVILGRRIAQLANPGPAGEAAKSTPYWRPPFRYESTASQDAERRKQIAEQQRLYRKYLMGPDNLADDPEAIQFAKRRWGDLPLEKLQAITAIEADYEELAMKQYAERRIRPGEETNPIDAQRLLQQEHMADIAKILTPEEFAAYELRASATANILRFRLETFNATEDEFKTLFAITKAYEDRLSNQQLSPDARKKLTDEINAKVKDAVGPDRALDYDAAVNQNNQDKTAGLVSRLGLPARVASEIRQLQQDLTQRAKDIRTNTQLAPNDRSAQLAALAAQAEIQLTAKLGATGYEAYNDVKGEWIRALKPKSGP